MCDTICFTFVSKTDGFAPLDKYDKCDLFWRQVIDFIQRGIPACDRQAFAHGIYQIIQNQEVLKRTFDFSCGGGAFPVTAGDHSRTGLGFELTAGTGGEVWQAGSRSTDACEFAHAVLKHYVEQKLQTCKTYAANSEARSEWLCFLLRR
jgi:hypothetical protein